VDAAEFLRLATACFELSPEPVNRSWYGRLSAVSGVAADIGGVPTTHINHLTPRVLDIDELYRRMQALGITMIDEIQGPPNWDGPDVLLRQTSFKALAEPRRFVEPDGTITEAALSVRFGEVEQRGIALTPAGRDRYDRLVIEIDQRVAGLTPAARDAVKVEVWQANWPTDEAGLLANGEGWFEFTAAIRGTDDPPGSVSELVAQGWLVTTPIVYEDFLPRSAAGIFASNLDNQGTHDSSEEGSPRDLDWIADAVGRTVHDPMHLYAEQSRASLIAACAELRIPSPEVAK
jgi:uncharacterized glyoxalase superfamily metalloenzyme YdcJ